MGTDHKTAYVKKKKIRDDPQCAYSWLRAIVRHFKFLKKEKGEKGIQYSGERHCSWTSLLSYNFLVQLLLY